jgi:hypothetical protein
MWTPAALVEFDSLRHGPQWRRWSELAANAPPYLAPGFFALVRSFIAPGTPLVAEAWTAERMLGALPLVLEGDTLRALRTERSPTFDYCGETEGLGAIWAHLRDDERWNELVLDKVPAGSPLVTHLSELARRDGCPITIRPDIRQPYLALGDLERSLAPTLRTTVEHCSRHAGELAVERIVAPAGADLEDARRIERLARSLTDGVSDERVLDELARLPGAVQYFLRIRGARVASLFALEHARSLLVMTIGHDPSYASVSPAQLMVWKVAQDAEQRGLGELRFAREDDTTRRWTPYGHEHVAIAVYRRTARGLVRHELHEVIAPHLPAPSRRCQRQDLAGAHGLVAAVAGRLRLGIRNARARTLPAPPGEPSSFLVGCWVRVRGAPPLDDDGTLRGLAFGSAHWRTIKRLYRVGGHVRRVLGDDGGFRSVDRTVLLEGAHCDGDDTRDGGCGRQCPLMYRDEWLEAAAGPPDPPPQRTVARYARVRTSDEIEAGLDLRGRRDGVTFMPEMAAYAGMRLRIVEKIERLYELEHHVAPRAGIYLLAAAHCTGAVLGDRGPCDRACALLWHEDWLTMEGA